MTPSEAALILLLLDGGKQIEGAVEPPVTTPPVYVDTAEPFPADRVLIFDGRDIGSAGAEGTGNTIYVNVYKGGITVLGMTMGDTITDRISFGVTANQITNANLRVWISVQPDGVRISEACSYIGYSESSVHTSTGLCELERGGSYYINIAACSSGLTDYSCDYLGARTADADGQIVMEAKYRR